MRQRAQKMRALAEVLSDPELKRLVREKADQVENEANELDRAKRAANPRFGQLNSLPS